MIEKMDWMQHVEESDFPESYGKINELIGFENTMKLVQNFSGGYLYVPKTDALIRNVRNRDILKRFQSGTTPQQLSQIYDLSVVQVYEIISKEEAKQRATPSPKSGK